MTDSAITQKRILVALDAFQDYQTLLDIAAGLAVHQSASLSALFVEDINLIHLAGLPFAVEIDRVSLNEQQLDELKVTQDLEKQADQIRSLLSEMKKQSRLQVSLTVVRGHYLAEAMAAATDVDLLLLNTRSNKPLRTQRDTRKEDYIRPVWVFFDGSPSAVHSLEIAGEIIKNHPAKLNIVLNLKEGKDNKDLEKTARNIVSDFHAIVHFFITQENDFTSILESVLQRGCSIMIMNWNLEDSSLSNQLASSFSDKAGCPVLLVS